VTAELARIGGAVACLGLATMIIARPRAFRVAGLIGWAAGAAALAGYLAPAGHHRAYTAAAVAGLVLSVALALVLRRWQWALPALALACAPVRIPVHVGGTDANLLLPLYAVVAAAAILFATELALGDGRGRELGPIAWPLGALVAWMGVSLLWTDDLSQGAIMVLCFVLPFGLIAVMLARLPWNPRWLKWLFVQLVAMAVAFAVVGIYQWVNRDVFWNPKVIIGNAYAPFYRVNSVFYDPSVYGRFLVIAITACLVVALHSRAVRVAYAAGAAIVVIWIGLLFSFSQSSFGALVAVVLVVAAMAWHWRAAAAVVLVGALLLSAGFAAPRIRSTIIRHSHAGLNHATSGRAKLVINGVKIVAHHPILGVGVGGFKRAYADQVGLRGREPKSAASHDTPVTVAAETGLTGLVLFAWLVWTGISIPLRRVPRSFVGRASLVFGLGFTAIAVHSLFYNAFFEDPMTWGLLGLAALAAREREREAE
jgi:putative inorganic carbon (HCO3(-)) transporter